MSFECVDIRFDLKKVLIRRVECIGGGIRGLYLVSVIGSFFFNSDSGV